MKMVIQSVIKSGLVIGSLIVMPTWAADTIKLGEINSYTAMPAFLEPYKKGWEMAVEEVKAAGG
ncbi:hypothetical protein, partial [Staphylococcus pasteuri_A]